MMTLVPKWKATKITELALWTPTLPEEHPPAEAPGPEEVLGAEGMGASGVWGTSEVGCWAFSLCGPLVGRALGIRLWACFVCRILSGSVAGGP